MRKLLVVNFCQGKNQLTALSVGCWTRNWIGECLGWNWPMRDDEHTEYDIRLNEDSIKVATW